MSGTSDWNTSEKRLDSLEKAPLDIELGRPSTKSKSRLFCTLKYAGVLFLLSALFATIRFSASSHSITKRADPLPVVTSSVPNLPQFRGKNNTLPSTNKNTRHDPYETFVVYNNDVVKSSFGSPVYSETLFNYVFAQSDGKPPYIGQLPKLPEGTKFNKVVVTLYTNVSQIQYDRLAHFYVAGNEVWRTSTIEPENVQFFSIFSKDLSDYATLFQTENEFVFQLDNDIDSNDQGAFSVQLDIAYYYDSAAVDHSDDSLSIFSTDKPADSVYPLVQSSEHRYVVTVEDTLDLSLPTVPQNTTRLILRVFTSGNGDEEFWYLGTPNPLRYINLHYNGQKIGTQAPAFNIFSGGFNPNLWHPILFDTDFDLPWYDFDITGLLPYAWEGSSLSKSNLQVQISNGLGEVGLSSSTAVGNGWITSASILGYESSQVKSSSGSKHTAKDGKGGDQWFDQNNVQIREASFNTSLQNTLKFELSSGSSVQVSTTFSSKSGMFSYYIVNSNFNVAVYSKSTTSSKISDSNNNVLQVDRVDSNPLLVLTPSGVDITHLRSTTTEKNQQVVLDVLSALHSDFGSYGLGSSGNVTYAENSPSESSTFTRQASSIMNSALSDESNTSGFSPINAAQGPTAVNFANFFNILVSELSPNSAEQSKAQALFSEFTNANS